MLSFRVEEKKTDGNNENRIKEALNKFYTFVNQPLTQIIDRFYSHDPEAIHQFHIRMVKPYQPDDYKTAEKTFVDISSREEKKDELTPEDKMLKSVLGFYLHRTMNKKSNIFEESEYLQEEIISIAIGTYNPHGIIGNGVDGEVILQEDDTFYRQYFSISNFDLWGIHAITDHVLINSHFLQSRSYVIQSNPNTLYLNGMYHELFKDKISHTLFTRGGQNGLKITFPPLRSYNFSSMQDDEHNENLAQIYPSYLNALAAGSDLALTGLARLFAQGIGGLKKDIPNALTLYKLAMNCNVFGALPLDSDDPRILYYSTMLSGMNLSGPDSFVELSNLLPVATLKTYWMIRMNYADPTVEETLEKFEKLAKENPRNVFDSLLDQDSNSLAHLKYCVSPDVYEHVLRRKQISFKTSSKILEQKLPLELSKYILSFISGSEQFLEDPKPKILNINLKKIFSYNLDFFSRLQKTSLIENRHKDNSGKTQHAYDKHFGLIKR